MEKTNFLETKQKENGTDFLTVVEINREFEKDTDTPVVKDENHVYTEFTGQLTFFTVADLKKMSSKVRRPLGIMPIETPKKEVEAAPVMDDSQLRLVLTPQSVSANEKRN